MTPSPPPSRPPLRHVLAVVPDASRTAATTCVLSLLRWARAERGATATVVALRGGPLEADLAAVADLRTPPAIGRARWLRRTMAEAAGADVVVAGGRGTGPAAAHLPDGAPPLAALLHEVGGPIAGLDRADLVVVPSATVAEHAVRPRAGGGAGVAEARVRTHAGPVDPPPRRRPPARDDVALVAGCGTSGWAGGTDLFVALADAVGPEVSGRAVHWVWLDRGPGDEGDATGELVAAEVALRDLDGRVHLAEAGPDLADRLAAADVLALTGRVEPAPPEAVLAALVGTPVVGLRPATDLLAEAGQDDRRIERLDLDAVAAQVAELLADADRARLVAAPQARAAAHATTPLSAPDLWDDLERTARVGTSP